MSTSVTTANERSAAQPALSVIIPSHNRRDSLRLTVLSLCEQDYPPAQVEVVVVLDGSTDGSAAMLAQLQLPFHLSVVEQPNRRAAAARNIGASQARGDVLVFMDDDMEASRSFLAEHAWAHAGTTNKVAIGYFASTLDGCPTYFAAHLRGWWAARFQRMRSEGHRYAYTDVTSGSLSVSRRLFQQVGGFNEALFRHEDYEFGYRLLAAGAELCFVEAAATVHHEECSLHRALLGKVAEGRDDVRLGRLHPSLKAVLPMRDLRGYMALPSRVLMHLAFRFPALSDRLARLCESSLEPLERARCNATWLRVLLALMIYWYWRGVAHELPSIRMLNEFLSTPEPESGPQPEFIVQLDAGVDAAAACLDEARPEAAALVYGGRLIGRIPALAGTERLCGRHLRPLLSDQFRAPLLHELTRAGMTGVPLLDERLNELAAHAMETWQEPEWRL